MGDLCRGALALCLCIFFLLLTPVLSFTFLGLFCIGLLFAYYSFDCVSRLFSLVEIDESGVTLTGGLFGQRKINWGELEQFELRHFSLGRIKSSGWMDLKLKGGSCTILVDDKLERFDDVLYRAWYAARAADVGVSEVTLTNLAASGLNTRANS